MGASANQSPTILAIDAAGAAGSAALWRDGALLAGRLEAMRRGQSERLVPMIQDVMDRARTGYPELDAIAVTIGPGGFTGVRIGLATARGLALACRRPILGISNFLALAAAARPELTPGDGLCVVIDAKRRDVYVQVFDEGLQALSAPAALAPAALAARLPAGPLLLVGDGVDQVLPLLSRRAADIRVAKAAGLSDAADVARLAASMPPPAADAPPPAPLYLRPPDVTLPADSPPPAGGPSPAGGADRGAGRGAS